MWSVFIIDEMPECSFFGGSAELNSSIDNFTSNWNGSQHQNMVHTTPGSETTDAPPPSSLYNFRTAYNYVIFTLAPTNVALNLVAMSIFYKEHRRRLLYYYMFLLCCIDTLFQIFFCSTIALYIVLHVNDDLAVSKGTFVGILLVRFLAVAAQLIRNWTVAFIAAYRCELIMMSASAGDSANSIFNNRKVAGRIWGGTVVLLLLASIPRSFDTALVICNNAVYHTVDMESTYRFYGYLYHGAALFVLQSGGPVICVLVTSVLTIRTLHLQIKYRKEHTRLIQRSNANRMVIAVSIIFMLCEMPAFFSKVIHTTRVTSDSFDFILGLVGNFFVVLDSTCNFFVYVFANGAFRQRLFIGCLHVYARRIPTKRRTIEALARIPLHPAGDPLNAQLHRAFEAQHRVISKALPTTSETDLEVLCRNRTPKEGRQFP